MELRRWDLVYVLCICTRILGQFSAWPLAWLGVSEAWYRMGQWVGWYREKGQAKRVWLIRETRLSHQWLGKQRCMDLISWGSAEFACYITNTRSIFCILNGTVWKAALCFSHVFKYLNWFTEKFRKQQPLPIRWKWRSPLQFFFISLWSRLITDWVVDVLKYNLWSFINVNSWYIKFSWH